MDEKYINDFIKLSKKYCMGCEFEEIDNYKFKPIKNPVIYCYNYKVGIYPKNKDTYVAHTLLNIDIKKKIHNLHLKKFIIDCQEGEGTIEFHPDDLDKLSKIFKIRTAINSRKTPFSMKHLNDYLRYSRNIHKRYGVILKNILENKKEKK